VISEIGIIFAVAYALCVVLRPHWLVWVLSAALPFSHTAMFIVGDNGVSPFWVGAIVAAGRLAYLSLRSRWTLLGRGFFRAWANIALLAFLVYSVFITIVGPLIFEGMPVITPRGGLDSQVDDLATLSFQVSNLAQGVYVILGVLLVIYVVVEKNVTPRVIEAAIVLGLALALFKHLAPGLWPYAWFDNSPSNFYSWVAEGRRERGSFAEPSILGMFLAMSLAYLVSAIVRATLRQRIYYAILIAVGVYMYAVSYTGTALLALGATAGLGFLVVVIMAIRQASRRQLLYLGGGFLAGVAAVIAFWPIINQMTVALVIEKLGTSSFDNRGASNEIAWELFLDTFGLGAGLGSNRPSSLFFMLLSCVGAVGTITYLWFVSTYAFTAWKSVTYRAVSWSLLAVFIAQVTAKPDLSMPFLWLLIALAAVPYTSTIRDEAGEVTTRRRHAHGPTSGRRAIPRFGPGRKTEKV
jgi:hypothetical protein